MMAAAGRVSLRGVGVHNLQAIAITSGSVSLTVNLSGAGDSWTIDPAGTIELSGGTLSGAEIFSDGEIRGHGMDRPSSVRGMSATFRGLLGIEISSSHFGREEIEKESEDC